jgi:DNA-binding CsgD family transcriptional regulator
LRLEGDVTEPDLARLSDAERAILALLARGHTAKSIAAETGRSEGSVHERLREARRKTGVGSSRELARMLATQENRDTLIGMVQATSIASGPARAPLMSRWTGALLMTAMVAALIATTLKLSTPTEPPPRSLFQVAAGLHYGDAISWREETSAQRRDAAWADAHEAVLRRRYATINGLDMATLHVECRESKCEVVGRSAAGASPAILKHALDELTSSSMRTSLLGDGLRAAFTNCGGRDPTREIAFLAYWVSPDD